MVAFEELAVVYPCPGCRSDHTAHIYGIQRTSRSNSSGPARGNNIEARTSIPGASWVEGGIATSSVSGLNIARCDGAWNAQFLCVGQPIASEGKEYTDLIVDTTPPRRIVSLCSVNTVIFASGYSRGPSEPSGLAGRGVTKNRRPGGD